MAWCGSVSNCVSNRYTRYIVYSVFYFVLFLILCYSYYFSFCCCCSIIKFQKPKRYARIRHKLQKTLFPLVNT
jgi:hypothetical protein